MRARSSPTGPKSLVRTVSAAYFQVNSFSASRRQTAGGSGKTELSDSDFLWYGRLDKMKRAEDRADAAEKGGTLLLFGGALGDFLCLLPGLFGLRLQDRGRITVVAQPAFLELLGREAIDTVSIDRREIANLFSTDSLSSSTFDLLGSFATVHSWIGHGDDNFATRLARVSGGTVRIHRLRGMRSGEHASAYLARCLGVRAASVVLSPSTEAIAWAEEFWRRHELGNSTLVVHPGSGSPRKNWRGMTVIARRWQMQRGAVLALCGPAEQGVDLPHNALVRDTSLDRVAALLRRGSAFLGNDSGISHLAGLAGTRGVVAFGPSDPAIWHPLGMGLRVCRAASASCRLCDPDELCTHVLCTDEVWEALDDPSDRRTQTEPSPSQMGSKRG